MQAGTMPCTGAFREIVGRSKIMNRLFRDITTVGPSDAAVLVEGETGVGKGLVARALHDQSPRSRGPFVAFSGANLSEELFESELFGHVKGAFSGAYQDHRGLARAAHGGTLFLDEAAELSWVNQGKLLRFLDDRQVRPVGAVRSFSTNVRVVCATNQDLYALVQRGAFRRDLFYRLRVFGIVVPPLRARQGDLPLLIEHFYRRFCQKYAKELEGVAPEALQRLLQHRWEGNVRELENEMERLVVMTPEGTTVGNEYLSPHVADGWPDAGSRWAERPERGAGREPSALRAARLGAEASLIARTLQSFGWNVSATARSLGISRVGLSRKLKRLGIERPGSGAGRGARARSCLPGA